MQTDNALYVRIRVWQNGSLQLPAGNDDSADSLMA